MDISLKLALSIFGLNENYSQSEISYAYRKLAKITHPDSGGDKNLFLLVKECKELLEKILKTVLFQQKLPQKQTQLRKTLKSFSLSNLIYFMKNTIF